MQDVRVQALRGGSNSPMIPLQHIYNFLLFHAMLYSVLDVYWALLYTFILFLGLTY